METLKTYFEQIPVETVKKIAQPLHEPTEVEWRELARQASTEKDPEKMLDLIQQVIEKYDETRRRGDCAG